MMSVRLGSQDVLNRFLSVYVVQVNDRDQITEVKTAGGDWVRYEAEVRHEPTLQIEEQAGRALLQELIRFYDGGEDTRSLRRDYDAERKRVDKMIDHLLTPA